MMKTQMTIEITKNYKITLTQDQAKQLYQLLTEEKDHGTLKCDGLYDELRLLYEDLKQIFIP